MYQILLNNEIPVTDLLDASVTLEKNKVGTCKFQIAADNPNYDLFKKLTSEISVIDTTGALLFNGRVLDTDINFYNSKTILCESSFSYFNDSVALIYDYQGTLKGYINKLLTFHNSQVSENRRIYAGEITVEDPNAYLHYSDSTGPTIMELLQSKVIKKYGGYMTVRKTDGKNYLDYVSEVPYKLQQEIKLGENLLDLAKESKGEDIYTVVYPTGARKRVVNEEGREEDGDPITIESVNNGSPFVEDNHAIEQFGRIVKHVHYDDVTEPMNLKNKAIKDLGAGTLNLEDIEIKAVDTSLMGSPDSFKLLRWVKVDSPIHGVEQHYLIEKLHLDLMNPENNTISVGGVRESLGSVIGGIQDGKDGKNGADGKDGFPYFVQINSSEGDMFNERISTTLSVRILFDGKELSEADINRGGTVNWLIGGTKVATGISYKVDTNESLVNAVAQFERSPNNILGAGQITLMSKAEWLKGIKDLEHRTDSLIEQTKSYIMTQVTDGYYSKKESDDIYQQTITKITQSANDIVMEFNQYYEQQLSELAENTEAQFLDISEYIRFSGGEIELGKRGNQYKLRLTREKITFLDSGSEVAYLSKNKLYVYETEILDNFTLGLFGFTPRPNGNLSLKKKGI
jgi:hypothetical protein